MYPFWDIAVWPVIQAARARRIVEIAIDYRGFEIPDQFVIGYGLDYGEAYRNLRFVGVLRPEVYGAAE